MTLSVSGMTLGALFFVLRTLASFRSQLMADHLRLRNSDLRPPVTSAMSTKRYSLGHLDDLQASIRDVHSDFDKNRVRSLSSGIRWTPRHGCSQPLGVSRCLKHQVNSAPMVAA